MLSTYTIWDQLWSALVTTLAKIVWTLLKAENRHTSQNFETLLGVRARDSAAAALYLLPAILTLPPLFPHGRCAHIVLAIFSGGDLSHVTLSAVTQLRVVTTPASQELRAAAAGQRSLPGPPEDITLSRDRRAIYLVIHRPTPCL